jgi:hypothetical protein
MNSRSVLTILNPAPVTRVAAPEEGAAKKSVVSAMRSAENPAVTTCNFFWLKELFTVKPFQ